MKVASEHHVDELPRRNGAAMEPLTHRRHDRGHRRGNANFTRKCAKRRAGR
ncbi:hypothetical protein [Halomonas elongata]|uniref:hypothetical protein n=1 Tax=Halomonas elongata TaxID=2746 RepID=UPI0023AFFC74|nr:hypothetical protein [Halomonas elongata]